MTVFTFDIKYTLNFRCRFEQRCISYSSYKKINPNSQLIIEGECFDECNKTDVRKIFYYFNVSFTTFQSNLTQWTLLQNKNNLLMSKQ